MLERLHQTLTVGKTAALTQAQAITGPGGIGKTQTALEYAYRYRSESQAVCWVRADTQQTLVSDRPGIASQPLAQSIPDDNAPVAHGKEVEGSILAHAESLSYR